MSKRNRTDRRQSTISIELPSKQHVEFLNAALTITNHYRLSQKLPIISLETFCVNAIVTGAKEVHEFYRKQQMSQEEQQNAQEASDNVNQADNGAGRVSTVVDSSAPADSEDSVSLSEGTNG